MQIVVQYMRLTALGAVPQLLHRRFEIELAWQVVSDNDGGAHAGVALRQVCEGIGTLPCRLPRGGIAVSHDLGLVLCRRNQGRQLLAGLSDWNRDNYPLCTLNMYIVDIFSKVQLAFCDLPDENSTRHITLK